MSTLEWAKREVEIACKKENPDRKEGEFDYGCACYESALKAFESLCEDDHSGFSIKMTQYILNRLISGKPLTPIEDTEDMWMRSDFLSNDKHEVFMCTRMSSLFKNVYKDGHITYNDVDNFICTNIRDPLVSYYNGFVVGIVEKMFSITMPYMPDSHKINIYCEDFLFDDCKNEDFDTKGILYAIKTENGELKKIEIGRYFKESINEDTGDREWIEISEKEYKERKKKNGKI